MAHHLRVSFVGKQRGPGVSFRCLSSATLHFVSCLHVEQGCRERSKKDHRSHSATALVHTEACMWALFQWVVASCSAWYHSRRLAGHHLASQRCATVQDSAASCSRTLVSSNPGGKEWPRAARWLKCQHMRVACIRLHKLREATLSATPPIVHVCVVCCVMK